MKMNKVLLILFILSLGSTLCFSQDESTGKDISLSDPVISLKYVRGASLLYDCVQKHWVCTGEIERERCIKQRNFEEKEKSPSFSCIPIKTFESQKNCEKEQARITSGALVTDYCENND